MQDRNSFPSLPPSGPWSGYYHYPDSVAKHRMKLGLAFAPDGRIEGEGIDDIAPFIISGFFDIETCEASWTKNYIGMHRVEYRGVYDGRSICGEWTIIASGGFWIWPSGLKESERLQMELEQPVEALVKTS